MNLPLVMLSLQHRPSPAAILRRGPRGFSLLELLTVVAIIGVIAVAAMPSVDALTGGRSLTQAVDVTTSALEFARQEARTRQTYVFVGFRSLSSSQAPSKSPEVQIGVLASRDGSADTSASNLFPLERLQVLRGAVITSKSALSQATREAAQSDPSATVSFSDSSATLTYPGNVTLGGVITFTPDGKVLSGIPAAGSAASAGFAEAIDIGLRRARSDNPPASAADAALYVYGSSARIKVYRP